MKTNRLLLEDALYKQQLQLYSNIIKTNPALEEDLLKSITTKGTVTEKEKEELAKYGLSKEGSRKLVQYQFLEKRMFLCQVVFFLLMLLFISLFYYFHLRKFYRRLDNMNLYVHDILNDKESINMREFEEGTFASLRNDMYKITTKLREQNEQMSRDKKYLEETLSDISHQIKTPLTSLYMMTNALKDEHLDQETKEAFFISTEKQLRRIEWLVVSLLKLSRLESGTITLKKEAVKISTIVKRAVEPLLIPIELKSQHLIIKSDQKQVLFCDELWTSEALLNMIKNAHEHTKEGGTITISWEDNPLFTSIFIKDDGEGISEEDIHHIFERFYKSKNSRSDSIGIGLNMARQIIKREQGEILVESEEGKGTTFTIKLYKNISD